MTSNKTSMTLSEVPTAAALKLNTLERLDGYTVRAPSFDPGKVILETGLPDHQRLTYQNADSVTDGTDVEYHLWCSGQDGWDQPVSLGSITSTEPMSADQAVTRLRAAYKHFLDTSQDQSQAATEATKRYRSLQRGPYNASNREEEMRLVRKGLVQGGEATGSRWTLYSFDDQGRPCHPYSTDLPNSTSINKVWASVRGPAGGYGGTGMTTRRR